MRSPLLSGTSATVAALVIGLALAVGGCASSETSKGVEPPPVVPDGFQRLAEDGASFAYPASWRVSRRPREAATTVVRISPPGRLPDATGAGPLIGFGRFEVSSTVEPKESLDAHAAEETAVYGRELVDEEDAEVPGAAAARRYEFEYESARGKTPMRKLDLVVVGADRRTLYNLIAQAPVEDDDELEQVIESFRLEG